MLRCGLLGRKLAHSYSPEIHRELGAYEYRLYEVEPESLGDFLENGPWDRLNVTIPYKQAVIPYLSALSETAKGAGSVNTLVRLPDGGILGDNTDVWGFLAMVRKSGLRVPGKKALVLGSGGASRAVCYALDTLGARPVVISRTGENNYTNLDLHRDASLVVNTTPVGMYPDNASAPLSLTHFPALEGVLDIIYNPARTALLLEAESRGIPAVNGLYMLVEQARKASERFTGTEIPEAETERIFRLLSGKMQNIVLVGMPGSGKSAVAALLAEKLGRPLADSDEEIVKDTGMPIPEYFARYGEAAFREAETRVLRTLSKASGTVIATGGGCVTVPGNYAILHGNSRIVWIRRDISLLPRDGRPLSAGADLQAMYARRAPMYARFADVQTENNGTAEETADAVIRALGGVK